MTTAHPRPDLAAYNEAARMTQPQLVTALRELLGAKLVAYLGKVKETRAVRQWAEGTRTIGNDVDVERLRIAYRAARRILATGVECQSLSADLLAFLMSIRGCRGTPRPGCGCIVRLCRCGGGGGADELVLSSGEGAGEHGGAVAGAVVGDHPGEPVGAVAGEESLRPVDETYCGDAFFIG